MSRISLKEITHAYAATRNKTWAHDRSNTVGGSEVGHCIRKIWFSKNDVPHDPDYVDRFGAKERGNLIESHWVVPALRTHIPEGVELLYAGEEQQTIADGYLSVTPDALLVGVARDCLAHLGVDDIGPSRCLPVEIKSIDPRVDMQKAKAEHTFQTQVQMGLLRHATNHQPDYALISYVDASFLDDVTEFVVRFDPRIYEAAQARARQVMRATDPAALHPEGKMSGGNECRYCPYASHCAHVTATGIPYDDSNPTLDEDAKQTLCDLVMYEQTLGERADSIAKSLTDAKQAIKDFLREHHIRRYHADGWSVSWASVKPKKTIDLDAARAAGVDLSPYEKEGAEGDRLVIKLKSS